MNHGIYVFEGIDGSGKSTQFELFTKWLSEQNQEYKSFTYPQYEDCLSGELVADYLNNEFGAADALHPKVSSLFFALNRFETAQTIRQWLADGLWVLLDRYTTANMGHQLGKLDTDEDRLAFLSWLEELEYTILGIPRPTKVFWLDMPVEQALKLLTTRENKSYIKNGTVDGLENKTHLEKARSAYAFVAERQAEWIRIDCMEGDQLKLPEEIHQDIIKKMD